MGTALTIVDAFCEQPFSGNPAAVCVLETAAPDAWMQAVAAEMNLSETAFVVPRPDGDWDLRWFTPTVEVELCGHATLASAHVVDADARFQTRSGALTSTANDDGTITVDFPSHPVAPGDPEGWAALLRVPDGAVVGAFASPTWDLIEVRSGENVVGVDPDLNAIGTGRLHCLVVADTTAIGAGSWADFDSVCRMFAPTAGIDEDPVTGAAHCVIAPWLAARTGRGTFVGRQASRRGGTVGMEVRGDRVLLTGSAVTVAETTLLVDP